MTEPRSDKPTPVNGLSHSCEPKVSTSIISNDRRNPLSARAVAAIDILVVNEHEYAIALGQLAGTQLTHQPGWPTPSRMEQP